MYVHSSHFSKFTNFNPANIEKIFIQNLFLRKLTSCHIFMTVPLNNLLVLR